MKPKSRFQLERLERRLGDALVQITRVEWTCMRPALPWRPPVNAYRCPDRYVLCVDLAGVHKEEIEIEIEPRRLRLSGRRLPPEPPCNPQCPPQALAMEIDYGAFSREFAFPEEVDPERSTAEQRNGLLWISLPVADNSPS